MQCVVVGCVRWWTVVYRAIPTTLQVRYTVGAVARAGGAGGYIKDSLRIHNCLLLLLFRPLVPLIPPTGWCWWLGAA